MNGPRYVWVDGEKRSRPWWFRVLKKAHDARCPECRGAQR